MRRFQNQMRIGELKFVYPTAFNFSEHLSNFICTECCLFTSLYNFHFRNVISKFWNKSNSEDFIEVRILTRSCIFDKMFVWVLHIAWSLVLTEKSVWKCKCVNINHIFRKGKKEQILSWMKKENMFKRDKWRYCSYEWDKINLYPSKF